jgi:hypothetical protein
MTDLRKLAKGKPCLIRIPGVCNHNPETTVLAHYSLNGLSGIAMKSPDIIGAWACSSCHDEIDYRTRNYISSITDRSIEIDLMFAHGVFRTQYELIKLGVIK